MFLCGIAYSGVISFINSYAIELNLTKAASFFFVVYAIFLFICRPMAGKLCDQKGENVVIYPAYIAFVFSLVLLTFVANGWMLLASVAIGYGTIMSSMQTIIGKTTAPERLGLAISTFYICMDAGMGTGPYVLGIIAEHFSFHVMYGALAVVICCLILAYYVVHGKKAQKIS